MTAFLLSTHFSDFTGKWAGAVGDGCISKVVSGRGNVTSEYDEPGKLTVNAIFVPEFLKLFPQRNVLVKRGSL